MIKISFSREELLSHSPCPVGIDLFDRCFPGGEANFDLTPFSFVLICQSGFAGWLIEKGLLASLSLKGVDLSSADLRSANLSLANLSSADLHSANLYRADLSSADLSDAFRDPKDPEIPGWTVVEGRLKKKT